VDEAIGVLERLALRQPTRASTGVDDSRPRGGLSPFAKPAKAGS